MWKNVWIFWNNRPFLGFTVFLFLWIRALTVSYKKKTSQLKYPFLFRWTGRRSSQIDPDDFNSFKWRRYRRSCSNGDRRLNKTDQPRMKFLRNIQSFCRCIRWRYTWNVKIVTSLLDNTRLIFNQYKMRSYVLIKKICHQGSKRNFLVIRT